MRVTTKGRYGLRAVLKLALLSEGKPIAIRQLADEEELSPEFLEQIFFRLRKAGIINSTRGPGGGFMIEKPLEKISVLDIFEAAGEGVLVVPCIVERECAGICSREEDCMTHDLWVKAEKDIKEYFNNITLQQLIDQHRAKGDSTE